MGIHVLEIDGPVFDDGLTLVPGTVAVRVIPLVAADVEQIEVIEIVIAVIAAGHAGIVDGVYQARRLDDAAIGQDFVIQVRLEMNALSAIRFRSEPAVKWIPMSQFSKRLP